MRIPKKFSTSISQVNRSTRKNGVSIGRIFKLIDKRSNYVFSFVAFSLVIIPLPTPPGFSLILALPAIFLTFQICLKGEIYTPKFLSDLKLYPSDINTPPNAKPINAPKIVPNINNFFS